MATYFGGHFCFKYSKSIRLMRYCLRYYLNIQLNGFTFILDHVD